MDRLSDPKFQFSFAISADGRCVLREDSAILKNVREAIDFKRCKIGEQPFCLRCKTPLNETDYDKQFDVYHCQICQTSFKWKKI